MNNLNIFIMKHNSITIPKLLLLLLLLATGLCGPVKAMETKLPAIFTGSEQEERKLSQFIQKNNLEIVARGDIFGSFELKQNIQQQPEEAIILNDVSESWECISNQVSLSFIGGVLICATVRISARSNQSVFWVVGKEGAKVLSRSEAQSFYENKIKGNMIIEYIYGKGFVDKIGDEVVKLLTKHVVFLDNDNNSVNISKDDLCKVDEIAEAIEENAQILSGKIKPVVIIVVILGVTSLAGLLSLLYLTFKAILLGGAGLKKLWRTIYLLPQYMVPV